MFNEHLSRAIQWSASLQRHHWRSIRRGVTDLIPTATTDGRFSWWDSPAVAHLEPSRTMVTAAFSKWRASPAPYFNGH
jgi:hypothetical protein